MKNEKSYNSTYIKGKESIYMCTRGIYVTTIVKTSVNNLNDDVNFKHIIEHALSCTYIFHLFFIVEPL